MHQLRMQELIGDTERKGILRLQVRHRTDQTFVQQPAQNTACEKYPCRSLEMSAAGR